MGKYQVRLRNMMWISTADIYPLLDLNVILSKNVMANNG